MRKIHIVFLTFCTLAASRAFAEEAPATQPSLLPENGVTNAPYRPGVDRIKNLGGRLLLDAYVESTQAFQEDRYIEFVGVSTPTVSLRTNHADLWLNNTMKQLCTRFDDGSSACLGAGGGGGTITSVTAGLGLTGGGSSGGVTLGLSTPIANSSIDGSSITKQGNTFNGASQLLLLSATNLISNSLVDPSSITKQGNSIVLQASSVTLQGNSFNGAVQLVQTNSSNFVPNSLLDPSSVTKQGNFITLTASSVTLQGNVFNGATQLVQTNSSDFVPNSILDPSSVTKQGNLITLSASSVTLQGNSFNAANKLLLLDGNAFVPNANLDPSSVTKQGNLITLTASSVTLQGNINVALLNSTQTFSGQELFNSSRPSTFTFLVNVGSFTGAGLSTCGDSTHALAWSSTNNLFSCQSVTGSASAGGSNGQIQYNNATALAGLPSFVSVSSVTISTPTAIMGTITNDNAMKGFVGESTSSYVTGITFSNGNWTNLTSVTLSSGDWDVSGIVIQTGTNVTYTTDVRMILSTTPTGTPGDQNNGDNEIYLGRNTANTSASGSIPAYRLTVSSVTVMTLKGYLDFSAGNPVANGRLSVRRVR